MTTITSVAPSTTGRLEELVDRLLATLFPTEAKRQRETQEPSLVRTVHEARRLRQSGDLDGGLAVLADIDTTNASETQLRWLYAEWLDIARRLFAEDDAALYRPATGRAAVLVPTGDGNATLQAVAVLGMRWPVGKTVSKRTLRGLRPLNKGGTEWS